MMSREPLRSQEVVVVAALPLPPPLTAVFSSPPQHIVCTGRLRWYPDPSGIHCIQSCEVSRGREPSPRACSTCGRGLQAKQETRASTLGSAWWKQAGFSELPRTPEKGEGNSPGTLRVSGKPARSFQIPQALRCNSWLCRLCQPTARSGPVGWIPGDEGTRGKTPFPICRSCRDEVRSAISWRGAS